jgi:predicted RND superfamily exporter protein
MGKSLFDLITRKPVVFVVAIVMITLLLMIGMIVKPGPTEMNEDWAPDHEAIAAADDFIEKFPSLTLNVPVLIHGKNPEGSPNVLTSSVMVEILELEAAVANDTLIASSMPAESPFTSLPHILALLIDPTATTYPELIQIFNGMSDSDVQGVFTQVQNIPDLGKFATFLLSTDLKDHPSRAESTFILIGLDTTNRMNESDDDRDDRLEKAEKRIDEIVESQTFTSIRPFVVSNSKINEENAKAEAFTAEVLFPLALIMIIIILLITYRSVTDLIFSVMALFFTLIWVQGITSLVGIRPSMLASMVPILLIGLGVDYGIHLTLRYREELVRSNSVSRAGSIAVVSAGAALLLAALTDMVGFLSNLGSPIGPVQEFGIVVAIGILSSYIIFVTFVPGCRVMVDRRRKAKGKSLLSKGNEVRARRKSDEMKGMQLRVANVMDLGASAALKRPKAVLGTVACLTLVLLFLATQVSTTFSIYDFLPQGSEVVDEVFYLQDNFDFSDELAVIYIQDEDLAQPEVFEAMNTTQNNLAQSDESLILVLGGQGLNSPLLTMQDLADDSDVGQGGAYDPSFAISFNENDTDNNNVPDQNIQGLLDYVWDNYPSAFADTLYQDESGKYTVALIRVKIDSKGNEKAGEIRELLKSESAPLESLEKDGSIEGSVVTGEVVILDVILNAINESMLSSILITIVVSGIMLTIVFYYTSRSLLLGLITILPVLLVLVWFLGSMLIMGISLNVLSILIAAISIGLGVTYAIHITLRFIEELEEHGDISKSIHNTVRYTGTALLGAATTTIVGFGILALSITAPMQQFGLLTAITILYSLIASIYVMPSMLVLWARVAQGDDPYLKVRHVFMERHKKFEKDLIKIYKDIKKAGKTVGEALDAGLITVAEATRLKHTWKYLEKHALIEGGKIKTAVGEAGRKIGTGVVDTGKKIGTAVDETGKKIGTAAVETGKKIGTAVDETGKKIETTVVETGKKVGTAVEGTGKKIGETMDKKAEVVKKKHKENDE